MLACFKNERITSASAMLFMADSERAAELALSEELDIGLHLNLTQEFTGRVESGRLSERHAAIRSFLSRHKYRSVLYHPFLRSQFEYVYEAQYEEYLRLYKRPPEHINGHHHMHLCTNMLVGRKIPKGSRVRRNFSFSLGEKNFLNTLYRRLVDKWLVSRYLCTDFFFSIEPMELERLRGIVELAKTSNVELMVHPERPEEYDYLMSSKFQSLIEPVQRGTYAHLSSARESQNARSE